jgi:two-component system, OmpR family, response regulator
MPTRNHVHMRILVVEDEPKLGALLTRGLSEEGHPADLASSGEDALWMAAAAGYDAIVLDVMLPGIDGFETCRRLRSSGTWTPVLMLTARDALADRIEGLDTGADDYLVKPFAFSELLARIEVLLRRSVDAPSVTRLRVADLELDLLTRTVKRADKSLDLLPREFQLLEYLMRNAGHVVTRTMLLENVWDYHFDPQTNVIDVHVSRLRQKIDKNFDRPLLHTVRGAGYCLRAAE